MIFVKYLPVTNERAQVESYGIYTNQFPAEEENTLLFEKSEFVVPQDQLQLGKAAYLYVNPETKQLWYEYVDRPLTTDEQIRQVNLKVDNAVLELTMMMFGGM